MFCTWQMTVLQLRVTNLKIRFWSCWNKLKISTLLFTYFSLKKSYFLIYLNCVYVYTRKILKLYLSFVKTLPRGCFKFRQILKYIKLNECPLMGENKTGRGKQTNKLVFVFVLLMAVANWMKVESNKRGDAISFYHSLRPR